MTEYETITSKQNPKIIAAASLSDKKNRDKSCLFALEGEKLLEEAIRAGLWIEQVFVIERVAALYESLLTKAQDSGARLTLVPASVYEKMTQEKSPQGIFACVRKPPEQTFETLLCHAKDQQGLLLLEDIQDPANVGAMIRTAVALGISNLIVTEKCADLFHYKTLRASMGTVFHVRCAACSSMSHAVQVLVDAGVRIFAAALCPDAHDVRDVAFERGDGILIGNESSGIRQDTLTCATDKIIIPILQDAESLNAAAAAAILLWEKQKRCLPPKTPLHVTPA